MQSGPQNCKFSYFVKQWGKINKILGLFRGLKKLRGPVHICRDWPFVIWAGKIQLTWKKSLSVIRGYQFD